MGTKKSKVDQIISEIASDFVYFLMNGERYNLKSIFDKIGLTPGKMDVERLLRIHFLLTEKNEVMDIDYPGVIDFIQHLPELIRHFKTTPIKQGKLINGMVKGQVNWSKTGRERVRRYPASEADYFCEWNDRKFNVPENILLKKLLETIDSIIKNDLAVFLGEKSEWIGKWQNKSFRDVFQNILYHNVYINRVETSGAKITPRMIERVSKSTNVLYRDAAMLYKRYLALMNHEIEAKTSIDLLRTTFIIPSQDYVLFEFYWVVQILKYIESNLIEPGTHIQPRLLMPGSEVVAEWKFEKDAQDYTCKLYHNSTDGYEFSDKSGISFNDLTAEHKKQFESYARYLKVKDSLDKLKPKKRSWDWFGRPDILLEIVNTTRNTKSLYIGEVKFTENEQYAATGLKELLEYLAMARIPSNGNQFIEDVDDIHKSMKILNGWLFIDNSDFDILEDKHIQLIKYGTGFNGPIQLP